jgi:hypothetical protein
MNRDLQLQTSQKSTPKMKTKLCEILEFAVIDNGITTDELLDYQCLSVIPSQQNKFEV